ncbi:MAG: class I SAM-dependent methyltransferase, partial [Anaerolineae bacterium]|nr:class I SAM-dependent methyltransferase [Anaerolineae bacterium]
MAPVIFPRIAHQYDALNRLISLGRDLRWRESAALALALPPDRRALDVGTGTGDMALTILRHWPGRS